MSEVTGSQLINKHRQRDSPQCAVTETRHDEEGRVGDMFHEVVRPGDEFEPRTVSYVMLHVTALPAHGQTHHRHVANMFI